MKCFRKGVVLGRGTASHFSGVSKRRQGSAGPLGMGSLLEKSEIHMYIHLLLARQTVHTKSVGGLKRRVFCRADLSKLCGDTLSDSTWSSFSTKLVSELRKLTCRPRPEAASLLGILHVCAAAVRGQVSGRGQCPARELYVELARECTASGVICGLLRPAESKL